MKRIIGLLAVVSLSLVLAGCGDLGILAVMGSASSLRPDGVSAGPDAPQAEAAQDAIKTRLAAGLDWLWQSVSGLRAKLAAVAAVAPHAAEVADAALEKARSVVGDVEAAFKSGDFGDALALWNKARDAIGKVAGMVLALAVTSAAGV